MHQTHVRIPATLSARVLHAHSALRNQRAQGMPGAWCARSRAWCVENTRVSHHGHTGNTRHSPRNGFNGFLRALLGDRAFLSPSPANYIRKLDASVGASGPHDFAVRFARCSSHSATASIASRSNVRDDRETPLCGTGRREYGFDLGLARNGFFLNGRLDKRQSEDDLICPSGIRTTRMSAADFIWRTLNSCD